MIEPILKVRDLTTKLKVGNDTYSVVENFSFNLYPGKTLAIVGESGCGKSMTALSLMRILPDPPALMPTGSVFYEGKDLLKLTEKSLREIRGYKIAMIFQDPLSALNPVYPIGDQLVEVAEKHLNLYDDDAISLAINSLRQVGIPSAKERLLDYPHQLSGGMRQRVMIAMALMCKPDILIADEPTTALDVTIQAQILELIATLQKEHNMAVLLITHDMGVVAEVADEVIVMYASQKIEEGSVRDIFDRMSHPYTKGLFNSRPTITMGPFVKLNPICGSVPQLTEYPKGCRFHPRCPYVMEKCRSGQVPRFLLDQKKEHTTLCWLNDKSEESLKKIEEVDGV